MVGTEEYSVNGLVHGQEEKRTHPGPDLTGISRPPAGVWRADNDRLRSPSLALLRSRGS